MNKRLERKLCHFAQQKLFRSDTDNWFRGHLPLCDGLDANKLVCDAINEGTPFMVARLGSTEMKPTLYFSELESNSTFRNIGLYLKGDIDYVLDKKEYVSYMYTIMQSHSGYFGSEADSLRDFSMLMRKSIAEMDLCGVWLNEYLLRDRFNQDIRFCRLGDLEPYDYEAPWSMALKGKRVLVIHPFANSIKSQYIRKDLVWPDKAVLPDFELSTIKAVQSLGGAPTPYRNWYEALDSMKEQMDRIDYDVALIGCGAYGLPLAAHAKQTGHIGIHLGGPLQILFGIKGKRWDNIPEVAKFYNEYWIRPSEEETPSCHSAVEDGCYW